MVDRSNIHWCRALDSVDELQEIVRRFVQQVWDEDALEELSKPQPTLSWSEVTSEVRKELKGARTSYETGYRRQSRSQSALLNLDQDLAAFLGWVGSLPSGGHQLPLCGKV